MNPNPLRYPLNELLGTQAHVRLLRVMANEVEKAFDLTIEVEGYTKPDISDLNFDGFIPLYGVLPTPNTRDQLGIRKPLTHLQKDRQLLGLSRRLAEAIEQDTSLIRRAREHIDRLLTEEQGIATRDITEWRDILRMYSIKRLSRFLASSSERANRLR